LTGAAENGKGKKGQPRHNRRQRRELMRIRRDLPQVPPLSEPAPTVKGHTSVVPKRSESGTATSPRSPSLSDKDVDVNREASKRLLAGDRLAVALFCPAAAMAIILFLIEKTPPAVLILSACVFGFLIHPIWHFARPIKLRWGALAIALAGTIWLATISWPKKNERNQQGLASLGDIKSASKEGAEAALSEIRGDLAKAYEAPEQTSKPQPRQAIAEIVPTIRSGLVYNGPGPISWILIRKYDSVSPVVLLLFVRIANGGLPPVTIDSYSLDVMVNGEWVAAEPLPLNAGESGRLYYAGIYSKGGQSKGLALRYGLYRLGTAPQPDSLKNAVPLALEGLGDVLEKPIGGNSSVSGWAAFNPPEKVFGASNKYQQYRLSVTDFRGHKYSHSDSMIPFDVDGKTNADTGYLYLTGAPSIDLSNLPIKYRFKTNPLIH